MTLHFDQSDNALIIAVNPMPRLYIIDLIKTLPHRNISVLSFYRDSPVFSKVTVTELETMGVSIYQYVYKSKLGYVREIRSAIKRLNNLLSVSDIEVFHCQPNHFLTNYPTFGVDRAKYHSYCVSLLPDGAANFYHPETLPYERNMKIKSLLGKIVGIPFHPYKGTYLATEHDVYNSYYSVGSAGVMGEDLPVKTVEVARPTSVESQDALLVLGQPHSAPGAAESYRRYLNAVKQMPYNSVHYKAHPAENQIQAQKFCDEYGFVKVEFSRSTEEAASGYACVVGVASSVLLNLRLLGWHDNIASVLDPDFLVKMTGNDISVMEEMTQAFKGAGIQELVI